MNYMRKTIKSIVEDKIISEQMETHTMLFKREFAITNLFSLN